MAEAEFRIFLPAVSGESRSAHNELPDDFGARDALARVQEQFVPGRPPAHAAARPGPTPLRCCWNADAIVGHRFSASSTSLNITALHQLAAAMPGCHGHLRFAEITGAC